MLYIVANRFDSWLEGSDGDDEEEAARKLAHVVVSSFRGT
jgi:hypothetical protein